jgi:flagellar biosynthetic protein FlhB
VAGEDDDGEDKTQDASARRLRQAREEGRAPLSREVAGLAVLAAGSLMLAIATPSALREAVGLFTSLLSQSHVMELSQAMRLAGRALLMLALPVALAAGLAAALGIVLQTGLLVHLGALAPDLGRISPIAGLKRVFGSHMLMQAAKSVLKVSVVGFAGWSALSGALPVLMASLNWTPGHLVEQIWAQLAAALARASSGTTAAAEAAELRAKLQEAERELAAALERTGGDDCPDYERAVDRFAELVKAEELAELNNSKLRH